MTTTLSSKGQVVIPLSIRKKLGLPTGASFSCHIADGKIILDPSPSALSAMLVEDEGYLALEAPPGAPEMTPETIRDILAE
jgi:AbrB family looped-hinge helix DNA binding protein